MTKTTITSKQYAFVTEYLVDLNGTQAAIRAGYSRKTANEQASRLLANVSISAAIANVMQERAKQSEMTQELVIQSLNEIRKDAMRMVNDEQGSHMRDSSSALRALELIGKHIGMWPKKPPETAQTNITLKTLLETVYKEHDIIYG